jgi:hypothetical protein
MKSETRISFHTRLFNVGNTEAHLTLILVWLMGSEITNGMTTAKFALPPAGLAAFVSK